MIRLVITALFVVTLAACGGGGSSPGNDGSATGTANTGTVNAGTGNADAGSNASGGTNAANSSTASVDANNSSGNTNNGGSTADGDGAVASSGNSGSAGNNSGPTASSLTATHNSGQTFLVWNEADDGVEYHVYRSNSPITNDNLGSATLLTEKWGALDENTSVNSNASPDVPRNFVVRDLAAPLADNNGLFVHTTQNGQQGSAYYAVTSVIGGRENRNIVPGSNATNNQVNEFVGTPRPVLTLSVNGGNGRVYTQYMDYSKWNPTLNGYAYNFSVALPPNYTTSRSFPLMVELHAFGDPHKFVSQTEFDWPVIQLFPSDPGPGVNTAHTWWYGFAADHNYKTQGSIPRSGAIENFTEQRVVEAINFLVDDGQYSVDSDLIHAYGHSMGGSGVLSMGMRYPSILAGIYASEPMTNYGASPLFQENFVQVWGERSDNLPIINNGSNIEAISDIGLNGSQSIGVYDWMNHQDQLRRRRGDRFAYLMVDHGKEDGTIDWPTQGRPMARAFTDARVGFAASAVGGVGHSWLGFDSVVTSVFGLGFGDEEAWRYPKSLSFPGIHNATESGSVDPGNTGDDRHNDTLEWSTPINNFHQSIVDTGNRYEITIRSFTNNQTADITPRNTNAFRPASGSSCSWTANRNSDGQTIGSGSATVDSSRLLTIPAVPIVTGNGTRLVISC